MEMMYYDVLERISSQIEREMDEIFAIIYESLKQTKYKYVSDSEEMYNYGIILNEIYEMFLIIVEKKSIMEGILGIFNDVSQIKENITKRFDSDGLYKKYFDKNNEKYYLPGLNMKLVDIAEQTIKMVDQDVDNDDIEENIKVYVQRTIDEVLNVLKSDIETALMGKEIQQDA